MVPPYNKWSGSLENIKREGIFDSGEKIKTRIFWELLSGINSSIIFKYEKQSS